MCDLHIFIVFIGLKESLKAVALRNLLEICKRSVQNMRALSSFQPCQMGIQTMGGKIPKHCFSAVVLNLKEIQVLLDVLLLTETKL